LVGLQASCQKAEFAARNQIRIGREGCPVLGEIQLGVEAHNKLKWLMRTLTSALRSGPIVIAKCSATVL
jgi:hypothetical protein